MTIVEFIEARLDEDEAAARDDLDSWRLGDYCRHDPARALREVEAKRAILDDLFNYEAALDDEFGCGHRGEQIRAGECGDNGKIIALRHLAAIDADHPDFQEEWRP